MLTRGLTPATATRRRVAAANALGEIGGTPFWSLPFGEPEWVRIPAGPFTMGDGVRALIRDNVRYLLGDAAMSAPLMSDVSTARFLQSGLTGIGYLWCFGVARARVLEAQLSRNAGGLYQGTVVLGLAGST